jgi:cytochrome b subunit of formate dehydrogenase
MQRLHPSRFHAWLICALFLLLSACGNLDGTRRRAQADRYLPPPVLAQRPRPANDPAEVTRALSASVHAKLDCADCHAPGGSGPGAGKLGAAQCNTCHAEEVAAYQKSVHGRAAVKGQGAARCQDCHGDHDIRSATDPRSLVYAQRLPLTCGRCHQNPAVAKKLGIRNPTAAQNYLESIHGRMLVAHGLLVAPSCVDCHGKSHAIYEKENELSTVSPARVATTCGRCHGGPKERYLTSVHGIELEKGNPKAPTCPTCHSAHSIVEAGDGFRLASDRICGKCHEDRLARYRETYHGRASDLGDAAVAACYDCHGQHAIIPSTNPRSTLSAANKLQTCRECHAGAPPRFAEFLPHANHTDRVNYPRLYWAFAGMTGLLIGTFAFFGVHTLLWLSRSLIEKLRDPEGFRETKRRARTEKGARLFRRFGPVDRFCHMLIIVSFLLLVATGMPLKFHSTAWARAFFDLIGGANVAGSLHRFAAILTGLYFVIHLSSIVTRVRQNRARYSDVQGRFRLKKFLAFVFGPDSPVPRWQDAKDIGAQFKWYFGRGPRPKFERFTYWEKFDYMAVFWGITVIGMSGLVMWFPLIATRVMPGWGINIAQIIHSDEALLAAGFIFTIHFFNGHFRPEKFPFDPVMFSGRVTEAELRHEHAAQYERLESEGRLSELEIADEWPQWKWLFNAFGAVALAIGVVLIVMIFWGMLH